MVYLYAKKLPLNCTNRLAGMARRVTMLEANMHFLAAMTSILTGHLCGWQGILAAWFTIRLR